ncbi:hypothetical protein B9Z55_022494 [Caenorhabditis nigoni]|uniref:Uncharacterized protein n=1 Tax=Caenorhabditis nigoni TaxID=1611254 RepID=A0A2G5SL43_9PELO|nr:hypothetical protein B9Z55_022494 [Caenorhabditis nigoni]
MYSKPLKGIKPTFLLAFIVVLFLLEMALETGPPQHNTRHGPPHQRRNQHNYNRNRTYSNNSNGNGSGYRNNYNGNRNNNRNVQHNQNEHYRYQERNDRQNNTYRQEIRNQYHSDQFHGEERFMNGPTPSSQGLQQGYQQHHVPHMVPIAPITTMTPMVPMNQMNPIYSYGPSATQGPAYSGNPNQFYHPAPQQAPIPPQQPYYNINDYNYIPPQNLIHSSWQEPYQNNSGQSISLNHYPGGQYVQEGQPQNRESYYQPPQMDRMAAPPPQDWQRIKSQQSYGPASQSTQEPNHNVQEYNPAETLPPKEPLFLNPTLFSGIDGTIQFVNNDGYTEEHHGVNEQGPNSTDSNDALETSVEAQTNREVLEVTKSTQKLSLSDLLTSTTAEKNSEVLPAEKISDAPKELEIEKYEGQKPQETVNDQPVEESTGQQPIIKKNDNHSTDAQHEPIPKTKNKFDSYNFNGLNFPILAEYNHPDHIKEKYLQLLDNISEQVRDFFEDLAEASESVDLPLETPNEDLMSEMSNQLRDIQKEGIRTGLDYSIPIPDVIELLDNFEQLRVIRSSTHTRTGFEKFIGCTEKEMDLTETGVFIKLNRMEREQLDYFLQTRQETTIVMFSESDAERENPDDEEEFVDAAADLPEPSEGNASTSAGPSTSSGNASGNPSTSGNASSSSSSSSASPPQPLIRSSRFSNYAADQQSARGRSTSNMATYDHYRPNRNRQHEPPILDMPDDRQPGPSHRRLPDLPPEYRHLQQQLQQQNQQDQNRNGEGTSAQGVQGAEGAEVQDPNAQLRTFAEMMEERDEQERYWRLQYTWHRLQAEQQAILLHYRRAQGQQQDGHPEDELPAHVFHPFNFSQEPYRRRHQSLETTLRQSPPPYDRRFEEQIRFIVPTQWELMVKIKYPPYRMPLIGTARREGSENYTPKRFLPGHKSVYRRQVPEDERDAENRNLPDPGPLNLDTHGVVIQAPRQDIERLANDLRRLLPERNPYQAPEHPHREDVVLSEKSEPSCSTPVSEKQKDKKTEETLDTCRSSVETEKNFSPDDEDDDNDNHSFYTSSSSSEHLPAASSSSSGPQPSPSDTADTNYQSKSGSSKTNKPVKDAAWKNQKKREKDRLRAQRKEEEKAKEEKSRLKKEMKLAKVKASEEKKKIEEERLAEQKFSEEQKRKKEEEERQLIEEAQKAEKRRIVNQINRDKKKRSKMEKKEAERMKQEAAQKQLLEVKKVFDDDMAFQLMKAKLILDQEKKDRLEKKLRSQILEKDPDTLREEVKSVLEWLQINEDHDYRNIRARSPVVDYYLRDNSAFKRFVDAQKQVPRETRFHLTDSIIELRELENIKKWDATRNIKFARAVRQYRFWRLWKDDELSDILNYAASFTEPAGDGFCIERLEDWIFNEHPIISMETTL